MAQLAQAVLSIGDARMKGLLERAPELVRVRFERDLLITRIPHWLYVGGTALHLAAAALNASVVRLLLKAGADPNAENHRRATPLHYACDPRPKSGGVWDPSSQAEIIRLLVHYNADLDHVDRGGASALHRAVRARSPAAVLQLLKFGASVHLQLAKGGSTPLHLAVGPSGAGGTADAARQQLEIFKLLLEHGADPARLDARGKSSYDRAQSDQIRTALQRSAIKQRQRK